MHAQDESRLHQYLLI